MKGGILIRNELDWGCHVVHLTLPPEFCRPGSRHHVALCGREYRVFPEHMYFKDTTDWSLVRAGKAAVRPNVSVCKHCIDVEKKASALAAGYSMMRRVIKSLHRNGVAFDAASICFDGDTCAVVDPGMS